MTAFEILWRSPVRRRRSPVGQWLEVLEGRVLLAGGITPAPGSPINGSPGVALTNVVVATFTIADSSGSPGSKWLAKIDWGDNTGPDKKVAPAQQSDGSFAFLGTHEDIRGEGTGSPNRWLVVAARTGIRVRARRPEHRLCIDRRSARRLS